VRAGQRHHRITAREGLLPLPRLAGITLHNGEAFALGRIAEDTA
jgi:hypothetical protein